MKLIVLTILSIVALTSAAPSQITNNNVGDIVNVGIHGTIDYNNQVDLTLVNVILGFLSQQNAVVVAPADEVEAAQGAIIADQQPILDQETSIPKITPEMIEKFKNYMKDYKIPI
jgi:hypothetical protein